MKFPILLPNIFNHPFTYESDIELKIGDFVEVPFGKSKMIGVVWDNFEKKNNKTYKIKKIIRKLQIPNLKKETLEFLNWFSEYNLIPKGMALKLVLLSGKPIEKLDKKFNLNFDNKIKKNFFNLTTEQTKSLHEINISDLQNILFGVEKESIRMSSKKISLPPSRPVRFIPPIMLEEF